MAHKKLLYFVLSALVIIPVVVFALSRFHKLEKEAVLFPIEKIIGADKKTLSNDLELIAKNHLFAEDEKYGIVIKNLKNGESYTYNGNGKFDSASLYKLWVLAVAFQKIKDGTLSEDEILSAPLENLDNTLSTTPTPTTIPEGQITQVPLPEPTEVKMISMRTGEAIEKMITISDNYSALLVSSKSGVLSITKFLKDYGLINSNYKQPPQTTANDIAIFYEKLYEGNIIDKESSSKMIEILKRQTLNDRIPKYLPEDVEIAHKTGELFNSKHDAGIVYSENGDYIIVVFSETKNPSKAAEKIAIFSKEVYDYFQNI
ncbi:MAG: hypothetical protein ACD_37C00327G0003 [uncultured bacterium]|nr:MAG: hypothetical protein ACD_37C00327G0003 [uncultured bacterium]